MGIFTNDQQTGSELRKWTLGDKFATTYPHHESIKTLWETKWRFPCAKSVYPFHDGLISDFEPVFAHLIKHKISNPSTDAYTSAFTPITESLISEAQSATQSGNHALASSIYLRVGALLRISRFPILDSAAKTHAYTLQKEVYKLATQHWTDPLVEENIPHAFARENEGKEISVYFRVPSIASAAKPVPTVLLITGLDGYRPDNTGRLNEFVKRGWGCVVVEIPGTGDCPADKTDAKSMERIWDSVFGWMGRKGVFDMGNVVAWGLSCGAYYAVRIAHTHKSKLRGAVAQGAGVHHFFDQDWLHRADGHEYPFAFTPALALKFGYNDVESFKKESQSKFSLLENGILDKPSARLLLINGTHDGIMPIEDSTLLLSHGSPKEVRFFDKQLHMGYPMSNDSVYPWLEEVMA